MTTAGWGAIVTVAIFVLSNIGLMIYWSAKITTILGVVQAELKDVVAELKAARGIFATKEDLAYFKAVVEKEQSAVWKRIDELKVRS